MVKIQQCLCEDHHQTIHDIAAKFGIGFETCHQILREELGMHHVAAKFVPRLLTTDQKQYRVDVCTELKSFVSNDTNFLSTVPGDESWIYRYNPETLQQSSQGKHSASPQLKKCRQVKSIVKSNFVVVILHCNNRENWADIFHTSWGVQKISFG